MKKSLLYLLTGLVAFSCVSTGAGSCSGNLGPAQHGELAQGTFSYECTDEELDPVCENLLGMTPFQERIAVGAKFSMWYVQHDAIPGEAEDLSIQSPFQSTLERVFEDSIVQLRFLVPDIAPVHAANYDGDVFDFLHIEGVEINQLLIARQKEGVDNPGTWAAKWEELPEEIVLQPGQLEILRVFPLSKDLDILPGSITDYQWTPPDVSIAAITPQTAITNIIITGIEPGTSTLEVELNGISKTIDVVVYEGLDGGTDAGSHSSAETGRY